jgi:hypothetical protein
MIQRRENFRFALKSSQSFGILCERGRKNFDRYFTIQLGVFGTVHLAHPTLADGRENLIRTGFVPVESGI